MNQNEVSAFIRSKCEDDGGCLRYVPIRAKTANRRKHPLVWINGKQALARRALYEAEVGPIRKNFFLVPTCGDECCIEPKHQKQISMKEKNMKSAVLASKGPTKAKRCAEKARSRPTTKLNMEIAREIRCSDDNLPTLAKRYGVDEAVIWRVRQNLAWKEYGPNPFAGLGA